MITRRKRVITYVTIKKKISTVGEPYISLAKRIQKLRIQNEMKQADLAKKVGLSRPSLANIEAARQNVYLHQIPLFAKAFRISSANLLKGIIQ
jgi:transcriptional regulator with XRE-family HTH domain